MRCRLERELCLCPRRESSRVTATGRAGCNRAWPSLLAPGRSQLGGVQSARPRTDAEQWHLSLGTGQAIILSSPLSLWRFGYYISFWIGAFQSCDLTARWSCRRMRKTITFSLLFTHDNVQFRPLWRFGCYILPWSACLCVWSLEAVIIHTRRWFDHYNFLLHSRWFLYYFFFYLVMITFLQLILHVWKF